MLINVSASATGIKAAELKPLGGFTTIYRLDGTKVRTVKTENVNAVLQQLPKGIYIVNGKKMAN